MAEAVPTFPFSNRGVFATRERVKFNRNGSLVGLKPSLSFILILIELEGIGSIDSNDDIKHFFSKLPQLSPNITIVINTHANILPPFETPLDVNRYISSENGTCTFNQIHNRGRTLDIVRSSPIKSLHEAQIEDILSQPRHKHTKLSYECEKEQHDRFCASTRHREPKTFQTGTSIFNKQYNLENPLQLPESNANRAIIIRFDSGMIELTQWNDIWYLDDILKLVYLQGAKNVTLFDYSCSEYSQDYDLWYGKPITSEQKESDLLKYGGRTRRKRPKRKSRVKL